MKRSEMFKLIKDILSETYGLYGLGGIPSSDVTQRILNTIEKSGMSPPKRTEQEGKCSFPPDGITVTFYNWEPEDE